MFAAVDNYGSDAKRGSDTGSDGRSDGTARYRSDDQAGTRGSADLYSVLLERTLADRSAFDIDLADIVAFDRHDLDENGAEIAPPVIAEQYAVK
jgi:hypothetical protein